MIVGAKQLADQTLALWKRRATRLGLELPPDAFARWTGYNDLQIIYPDEQEPVALYVIRDGQIRYSGRRLAERFVVVKLQEMLRGYVDAYVCRHDEPLNLGVFRRHDIEMPIKHTWVYGDSPPDHINVCWAYAARRSLPSRIDHLRILVRENIHTRDGALRVPYPTVKVSFGNKIAGLYGDDKDTADYLLELWSEGVWQDGDFAFKAYRRESRWRNNKVGASDIACLGVVLPTIRYVRDGVVRLNCHDVVALRMSAERA